MYVCIQISPRNRCVHPDNVGIPTWSDFGAYRERELELQGYTHRQRMLAEMDVIRQVTGVYADALWIHGHVRIPLVCVLHTTCTT